MTATPVPSVARFDSPRAVSVDLIARLLWIAAVYLSAASFPAADWADHLSIVPLAALVSAVLGVLLAQSRFRGRTAFLLTAAYGILLLGWLLGRTLDPSMTWLEREADLIGRTGVFLLTVARGEASRDPLMFVQLMGGLYWCLGAYGSWVLFRRHGFWGAALLPGLALVLNTHFYRGGTEIELYLPAYLLLALTLALRTEMSHHLTLWGQTKALVPSDASFQIVRAGLTVGVVLIAVAWLLPGFAAYEQVAEAWSQPSGPLRDVRDFFSDALGGLRYPVTVVSESFGESLALGAGVQPSDQAVFVAEPNSPVPDTVRLYWRARVLDTYSDGNWTTSVAKPEAFDPRLGAIDLPSYAGRVEMEFAVIVRVEALHLLYVPVQPSWVNREADVRMTPADGDARDVLDITARQFVLEGETYRVIASLSAPRAGALRAAGETYPDWVADRYLALPDTLPPRIRALAEHIAGDAPTPYDKAVALTAWLRSNIAYQRVTPAPPEGVDPVEWFLFDTRRGFCDYYASADVLMLRALGVPARLAVGYAQGKHDAEKNAYYVSALDSHAWPEVYFPSYGWVEFEPTRSQPALLRPEGESGLAPGSRDGSASEEAGENGAGGGTPGPGGSVGPGSDIENVTLGPAGALSRRRWWWVVGFAGLAVFILWLRSRWVAPAEDDDSLEHAERRGLAWWAGSPARRAYRSMILWTRGLGVSPGPSATPFEQAQALGRLLPESMTAARDVAEAYALERYGLRSADPRTVHEAWGRLRWRLPRAWLARRAVPRLFGGLRRRTAPGSPRPSPTGPRPSQP